MSVRDLHSEKHFVTNLLKTALVKIFVLNFYPNINLTYIIPV